MEKFILSVCIIFRCRSAFKLIEIIDRTKLFQPGQTIIDCGAAPGSWTEVAVNATNANGQMKNKPQGFVVAIDRLLIHPIEVRKTIHMFIKINGSKTHELQFLFQFIHRVQIF